MFKAVIYDLFGTILLPWDIERHLALLNRMATILQINVNDFIKVWSCYAEPGMTGASGSIRDQLIHVCADLSASVRPEQLCDAEALLLDDARVYLSPTEDALATMMRVKDMGMKSGLITNCGPEVPALWQELQYSSLIDVPLFSCMCGLLKPHQGLYLRSLDLLGVPAEQVLFVDDNPSFVDAARVVGLTAVLVSNNPAIQMNDRTISQLSDILLLLAQE